MTRPSDSYLVTTFRRRVLGRLRGYGSRPTGREKARPILSDRAGKPIAVGVVLLVAIWLVVYLPLAAQGWTGSHIAWDFDHYLAGARAFIETGSPYDPATLTQRYAFDDMAFVHPPIAMVLFVPFLWLPAVLWWIVPLGILAWSLWSWRSPLGLAMVAVLWALPLSIEAVFLGNSSLWASAFVALGLRYGWWALLVIKPTFLPLALLGGRRRETWIGFGIAVLVALPFGALWFDWLAVLRNFDGPPGYTFFQLPLVVSPVVAWISRGAAPGGSSSWRPGRRTAAGHVPSRSGP